MPNDTDHTRPPAGSRSFAAVGADALMLIACLAGPVLAGAIGGLGIGVLLGTGGAMLALALCAAMVALVTVLARRAWRRDA